MHLRILSIPALITQNPESPSSVIKPQTGHHARTNEIDTRIRKYVLPEPNLDEMFILGRGFRSVSEDPACSGRVEGLLHRSA